jgi:predicted PurR-regulated permease PerM
LKERHARRTAKEPVAILHSVPVKRPASVSAIILAGGCVVAALYLGRPFFVTMVIAVIIAFILDPFVQFFVRLMVPRGVASFLVCSIALALLYLFGLGVYWQAQALWEEMPVYGARMNELVDAFTAKMDSFEKSAYQMVMPKRAAQAQQQQAELTRQQAQQRARRRFADPVLPPPPPLGQVQEVRIRPDESPWITYLYANMRSLYTTLLMLSFVPFLVYFMLSWRDHIRRSFLNFFEGETKLSATKAWEGIANVARAYVLGNFILGVVLAVVSSVCFYTWHLPYWPLVGILSGFLSLVPYAGLPLAIVPPLFAALPVYSTVGPYLMIATLVAFFHLLALNLLYPKMVGSRVHLNPLVVTVALMFWGTLWGGVGLVLAIPIVAGVKAVFDAVDSLGNYGRILGD